jgi:hypothetical protein
VLAINSYYARSPSVTDSLVSHILQVFWIDSVVDSANKLPYSRVIASNNPFRQELQLGSCSGQGLWLHYQILSPPLYRGFWCSLIPKLVARLVSMGKQKGSSQQTQNGAPSSTQQTDRLRTDERLGTRTLPTLKQRIWAKVEASLWVIAASFAVVYGDGYTNLIDVIAYDGRIRRLVFCQNFVTNEDDQLSCHGRLKQSPAAPPQRCLVIIGSACPE